MLVTILKFMLVTLSQIYGSYPFSTLCKVPFFLKFMLVTLPFLKFKLVTLSQIYVSYPFSNVF